MKWTYTVTNGRCHVFHLGKAIKVILSEVVAYLYCAERNGEHGFPTRGGDRHTLWEHRKHVWAAGKLARPKTERVVVSEDEEPKPKPKGRARKSRAKKQAAKK